MEQDTKPSDGSPATTADFESKVAAIGSQLERGDVSDEELSADLDAAVNSAPELVKLAELLAADGGPGAELRLRHLSELINKGALDQDIYEAVVQGTVYVLEAGPAVADLMSDFRLRCKCELRAFTRAEDLLAAAAERLPDAVLLGGGGEVSSVLPELVAAAFGREPVPVVLLAGDASALSGFEVLTYPKLASARPADGADGLLAALAGFLPVERTGASFEPGKEFKEQIGLTKAQAIQHNLLPETIPSIAGLDIAAYYEPCQEVGGDYYDFLELPDGRLGVVCADVSGKGVGAAMVMVMFRSILRPAAQQGAAPRAVILHTNQLVSRDMLKGMFVSAAYLIIDPATGCVELVNAGHMPVQHWPFDQVRPVEVPVGGMVVGLATGKQFEDATPQAELALEPGELLCLYTDGIVEAEDPSREQFGSQRLAEAIRKAGRETAAQGIVDHVIAAVEAFCAGAPQHDDATLIIAKAT